MSDPMLSAAREVLRCKHCGRLILVLSLEAPGQAHQVVEMLYHIISTFKMRNLLQCENCLNQEIDQILSDLDLPGTSG